MLKPYLSIFALCVGTAGCLDDQEQLAEAEQAIAGGTPTATGEHEAVGKLSGCSASLVARDVVLTAAHCVCNEELPIVCDERASFTLTNVVRYDDPTTAANEGGTRGDVTIAGDVVAHPDYFRGGWLRSDYAVIHLDRIATDLAQVTPLPVEGHREAREGELQTLVGYGRSNTDTGECTSSFGTKRKTTLPVDDVIAETATSRVLEFSNQDRHVCKGDSGGPIIDGNGRIQGVASYGDVDFELRSGYHGTVAVGDWIGNNAAAVVNGPSDRRAGILWQYTNGNLATWYVEGGVHVNGEDLGTVDSSWAIAGTGDFDGDGSNDILWRASNGQVAVWYLANGVRIGTNYPGGSDGGLVWAIQAVADFDHDGRSDILWRSRDGYLAIWHDGNNVRVDYPADRVTDTGWQVKGAADFDGDRNADILWRHTNGQVAIWRMRDGNKIGESYPGGQDPSLHWTVQATGDFDADGRADILWRSATGVLAIWDRGDATRVSYPSYGNAGGTVDLAWSIKGVTDFDGDGRSDILWLHTGGQVNVWHMHGGQFQSEAGLGPVGSGWNVRGLLPRR
jgi:V8-like Glu-specific endopeptidase